MGGVDAHIVLRFFLLTSNTFALWSVVHTNRGWVDPPSGSHHLPYRPPATASVPNDFCGTGFDWVWLCCFMAAPDEAFGTLSILPLLGRLGHAHIQWVVAICVTTQPGPVYSQRKLPPSGHLGLYSSILSDVWQRRMRLASTLQAGACSWEALLLFVSQRAIGTVGKTVDHLHLLDSQACLGACWMMACKAGKHPKQAHAAAEHSGMTVI